ncbi:ABC transporter permease [Lachnospiraceae bacterium 29-91]
MNEMLKTLGRRSFAANRLQNLIAVLAIALTAVLFTSVTTIGMGATESMTLTMQLQKGSKSDGDFRNMTAEQFEMLKKADFVESAGLRMPVNFLSNTKRHNVEFDVLDEIQAELTFCSPVHGRAPEADNEIVASDLALRDLGAEPEVGAEVEIEFTAHEKPFRFTMKVSGWYEATSDQLSMMWAGTAFRDAHPEIFFFTYDQDREMAGTYDSDFTAVSTIGLQDKMDQLAVRMGGDPYDIKAENYIQAVVNTMTNPAPDLEIIAMAAVLIVLFTFCGYLLIYNVFDIAVMKEIRRYGLYRTIGMSRKQVKGLINRQALQLSCVGIPVGLAGGFLAGKLALPFVMDTMSVEYGNVAVEVSPSPVIFLGAALLTALTVFLSTRKPVRIAANIPPVEAFRYVENSDKKQKKKGKSQRHRSRFMPGADISRLAWFNLGRNKRRSVFIVISLTLCVVLLNCVGTVAVSLDVEKQASFMIRSDFAVTGSAAANNLKGFRFREDAVNLSVIEEVAARPGVRDAAPIYKNTVEDTDVTFEFGRNISFQEYTEESGMPFCSDESGFFFGLGEDGRPVCNVYGMEESTVARMDLREGETDAHTLYEKMLRGEGVLVGVNTNRADMSIMPEFDFMEVGKTVTVYKDGQKAMELPVLAKAALNGDDQEIGYTCNGPMQVGGDGLFLYLPADIYKELYDEPSIYKYAFNVEEDERENMTAFLEAYVEDHPEINYLSSQSARESAEKSRMMIQLVGGLVGTIFGVAGVLNLINTLITTILARRREFSVMQSIGMTERQLTKMMVFEGIYYAGGACTLGILLGTALDLTLIRGMLAKMWQYTFHFTLLPTAAASVILLALSAAVPVLALRFFYKGSIVEQLRVAE